MKRAIGLWLLLHTFDSARAHHGNAEFDLGTVVRFEGVIVEQIWRNPHTVTMLETRTPAGEAITLEIEGGSPSILRVGGFTAESLAKGERVTAVVSPSRRFPNESAYGYEIIKADGSVVPLGAARIRRTDSAETATDIFGAWVPTADSFTRFTRSLPGLKLTEQGAAQRRRFTPTQSGQARCEPVSAPMLMVYPVVMVLERAGDLIRIETDWLGAERVIFMDGRAHPPSSERSAQGHSTGRWEGDVLVVETTNFADQETGGVPSGSAKRLTERFALAEGGKSLSYSYVWADADYLAEPASGTAELAYRPDLAVNDIGCDRANAERFFREFR